MSTDIAKCSTDITENKFTHFLRKGTEKKKDEYRRKEERGKKTIEKNDGTRHTDEGGWLAAAFTLNKGSPVFESHVSRELFADRKKERKWAGPAGRGGCAPCTGWPLRGA